MADYFKDVDPKMLSELKKIYQVDFEMFGYDFNVWTINMNMNVVLIVTYVYLTVKERFYNILKQM